MKTGKGQGVTSNIDGRNLHSPPSAGAPCPIFQPEKRRGPEGGMFADEA